MIRMHVGYNGLIYCVALDTIEDWHPLGGFRGRLDFAIQMAEHYKPYGFSLSEPRVVTLSDRVLKLTEEDLTKIYLRCPGAFLMPVEEAVKKMLDARKKYEVVTQKQDKRQAGKVLGKKQEFP